MSGRPEPNQPCQPTPGERLSRFLSLLARRGCTLRWAAAHLMKRILIAVLIITASAGFLFAQGWINGGPKAFPKGTPTPVSLPEAYAAAIRLVGTATNHWWCTAANCAPDPGTTNPVTHWDFVFSNTNGETRRVWVLYDGEADLYDRGVLTRPFR
jgi:hypothetical protein